ncbi:protein CREG1 [Malaya genurostris]|uniref:protein CREG1 n=1 Tax=Malaya genurostris TaxID=325434 RepID=UPI0026F38288|nr:protein CREG1 [Malaya genurostris]XP_058467609.1 protein CREG1 [Malaya genurostris]XP_058467610.1 protein CREG1 [Malaya genurostris]
MTTSIPIEKIIYHRLDQQHESAAIRLVRMLRICGVFVGLLLILLVITSIETRSSSDTYAAFLADIDSNSLENNAVSYNDPPPHTEYAKMARYLVHKAEWVSMGSLSTVEAIKGYPMVNIIAAADSARGEKSTGTLFFYLTMLDYTAQDLSKDNRLTVLLSMDQDLDCSKRGVDPMEPTCARIMISGRALKVQEETEEFTFGTNAMFSRHPAAKHWLDTHNFFLCKLDIVQIAVLDYYGGPHYVTVEEYKNADPDSTSLLWKSTGNSPQQTGQHASPSDEKTVTLKIKKDSPIRHINIEI